MDLHLLHKQGLSIRQIARQSGLSRNTVRAALRRKSVPAFATPLRSSGLDAFKPWIEERLAAFPTLSAVRLREEIAGRGYTGGVHQVRRFMATLQARESWRHKATVRFETAPGHQAQADWFEAGTFSDPVTGLSITYHGFIMVLGFSRRLFVTFVTSMKLPVLIACHQEAWSHFGGVTAEVLYDNMKQVRLDAQKLQPEFADYAAHCGFAVKTCRPYRPRTKGKVERGVSYVRDSFLTGRSFAGLADLNAQALHWALYTVDSHIHATTGASPAALFAARERAVLQPLPATPWTGGRGFARLVSADSLIPADGSCYSVPPEHIGQRVQVRIGAGDVTITTLRAPQILIATHARAQQRGSTIAESAHLQALWKATAEAAAARPRQPAPSWQMRFEHTAEVATTPLSAYEQLAV